jgi:hypothetical protein
MSNDSRVSQGFDSPHVALQCTCSWEGTDADIDGWVVDLASDRAVRKCPDCGEPVPEWGALCGIDGLATVARGPLRRTLADAGVIDD